MTAPTRPATLVLCSKSRWLPAIRREHALAQMAVRHGHRVLFVERPLDLRALRDADLAAAWWRGLRGRAAPAPDYPGVEVVPHSTLVPGHRDALGELSSAVLLGHRLRRLCAQEPAATIVANVPWQWPAVWAAPAARRVFDCADDWSGLMEHRSERLRELCRRIGAQADAVIVANPSLAEQFPGGRSVAVRNGVAEELLSEMTPSRREARLVYTGTLTPRFDAELVGDVLAALPEWSLDLYGQCQYPGSDDGPGPELRRLLERFGPRVCWHGSVSRRELPSVIDRAGVAILPNRPERSLGQDAMKLYDYAARGRPIVCTRFDGGLETAGPPHLRLVDGPADMVAALTGAFAEPPQWALDRRAWAERQRWEDRWPAWSAAVFGAST